MQDKNYRMTKMFTIEDVEDNWQISYRTLLRAIEKGQLKGVKFGRVWRFTEDQLNEFIETRTVSYKREVKKAS